jgi:hypothetical protein
MPRIGAADIGPDGERIVEGRLSSSFIHSAVASCGPFSLFYPCHPCDPWSLCIMFLVAAERVRAGSFASSWFIPLNRLR